MDVNFCASGIAGEDTLMAWSRIEFQGRHFDASNSVMEVWLRLVIDEIDKIERPSAWLAELRDEWTVLTRYGAGIDPDLDTCITDEERRQLMLALCDQALLRLRAMGDPIPAAVLNGLGVGPQGCTFTRDPKASVFVDEAEAFTDLLRHSEANGAVG